MNRMRSYWIVLAGALLWCLAIAAVPLLAATGGSIGRLCSGFLGECFSHVCHRLPDRSFYLAGEQLGVCVRCSAIYVGFLLGVLALPLVAPRFCRDLPSRWWLVGAALPTAIDAAFNILSLPVSTEASRALTGALLGVVLPAYIVPLLTEAFAGDLPSLLIPRRSRPETNPWMNDRTKSASPS